MWSIAVLLKELNAGTNQALLMRRNSCLEPDGGGASSRVCSMLGCRRVHATLATKL